MPGEFLNQSRSDPSDDPTADPTRTPTFSDVRKIYTVMVIKGRAYGLPRLPLLQVACADRRVRLKEEYDSATVKVVARFYRIQSQ
jgi:hypothetical protein